MCCPQAHRPQKSSVAGALRGANPTERKLKGPNLATLIKTNGEVSTVNPKNGTKFTLPELQGFVGGHITRIAVTYFGAPHDLIVNEGAKRHGLPSNIGASIVARQPIVGDALIVKQGEW